jgi:hypothetical protein
MQSDVSMDSGEDDKPLAGPSSGAAGTKNGRANGNGHAHNGHVNGSQESDDDLPLVRRL